jgi:hypothetical protein
MKESWSKIRANVQVCTNPDTCLWTLNLPSILSKASPACE